MLGVIFITIDHMTIQLYKYRGMFAIICALENKRPFSSSRFYICLSLEITPQTLVDNNGLGVYIIMIKIYVIICTCHKLS